MDSKERVLAALSFERPDRMPVYDEFWPEFVENWRRKKGFGTGIDPSDYYEIDVRILIPDEAPFPSRNAVLKETAEHLELRDGWGAVRRCPRDIWHKDEWSYPVAAYPIVQAAIQQKTQLDQLEFEDPLQSSRYPDSAAVETLKSKYCLFVKTGGPYLRTSFLRGPVQWLMDLVEDEEFARKLAMKVTIHLAAVGLEAMRRYDLYETGLFFHDDMAHNRGLMFSPRTFERVLLPCYKWMFSQYKNAGARNIIFHSDGNIESILEMMVDAGATAIHPVEPKAGMDVVRLRERYGSRLGLVGGLDNAHVLPVGSAKQIRDHVMRALEVGMMGGLVIGSHSIGPDVPVANYDFVWKLVRECGDTLADEVPRRAH